MRWEQWGWPRPTAAGIFSFLELDAPASYVFCNNPSPDDARAVTYGYPVDCFPGGPISRRSAAPLTLSPGQQAELDIALTRQRFYRVSIATANLRQGQGASIEIHGQGRPADGGGRCNVSTQPGDRGGRSCPTETTMPRPASGEACSYGPHRLQSSDGPIPGLIGEPACRCSR